MVATGPVKNAGSGSNTTGRWGRSATTCPCVRAWDTRPRQTKVAMYPITSATRPATPSASTTRALRCATARDSLRNSSYSSYSSLSIIDLIVSIRSVEHKHVVICCKSNIRWINSMLLVENIQMSINTNRMSSQILGCYWHSMGSAWCWWNDSLGLEYWCDPSDLTGWKAEGSNAVTTRTGSWWWRRITSGAAILGDPTIWE